MSLRTPIGSRCDLDLEGPVSQDYPIFKSCYDTAIESKYKNKNITLYQLCSGETITYKIRPATMEDNPIQPGEIIKVLATKTEGKWSKDGETWVQSTTDFNEFLTRYSHVR